MVFFGTPELRRSGERAAAAEKLAEWQETIFLLSRQLKALHLPTELIGSQQNVMHQMGEGYEVDESQLLIDGTQKASVPQKTLIRLKWKMLFQILRVGVESPPNALNSSTCPSDTEANMLLRCPVNSTHPRHQQASLLPFQPQLLRSIHGVFAGSFRPKQGWTLDFSSQISTAVTKLIGYCGKHGGGCFVDE